MSGSEFKCTSPELRKAAEKASEDWLPQKSKSRYESAYRGLGVWCFRKSVQNVNSEIAIYVVSCKMRVFFA
jgi:hypothetical protein